VPPRARCCSFVAVRLARRQRGRAAAGDRSVSCQTLPLKTATLIYNPVAGRHPRRREAEVQKAAAELRAQGLRIDLVQTSAGGEAQGLARAAAAHSDVVIVCGGDGTINEAINGLSPGHTILGILPGGTANILAKELGLPHDIGRAARELPRWSPRRVALGLARWGQNGAAAGLATSPAHSRYFLSVAGVGFDAYVIHRLSASLKRSWGTVGYAFEAWRQLWRYRFPEVTFRCSDREWRGTLGVVQRTRRYAGWFHLAPQGSLFKPGFTLCVFRSRRRTRYVLYALAAAARVHTRLPDVTLVESQQVDCEPAGAGPPIYFELDGELAGTIPATFQVVPGALTLLAPSP
jgi:diacylglycerol kinase (ATP)